MAQKETHRDVCVSSDLTTEQKQEVENLLASYKDVFTDKPGLTTLVEFSLAVTNNKPINLKPYVLPHAKLDAVMAELQEMLKLGIIEPAEGAYCSPIMMVKKKDASYRFCVDYRRLKAVTEFLAEPMPDPEGIFTWLAKANYFTQMDLTKGYWQIPVKKEYRPKLAISGESRPSGCNTHPVSLRG